MDLRNVRAVLAAQTASSLCQTVFEETANVPVTFLSETAVTRIGRRSTQITPAGQD